MKLSQKVELIVFALVCLLGMSFQVFIKNNPSIQDRIEPTDIIEVKVFDLSTISEIIFDMEVDVTLEMGDDQLEWERDIVLDSLVMITIDSNKLIISAVDYYIEKNTKNKFTLSISEAKKISLLDGAKMTGNDTIGTSGLDFTLSRGASLDLDVRTSEMKFFLDKYSYAAISGMLDKSVISLEEQSRFHGRNLTLTELEIIGINRTETYIAIDSIVTGQLDRHSKLYVYGNPRFVLVETNDDCTVQFGDKAVQ